MFEKLKPCPFCGGEARLTYSTDNHHQPYVTCDTPKCPGCNGYQWHYHTEAEAIEAWNRRAERNKGEWNFIGDNMFECTHCGVVYTTQQLNGLRNYDVDPYAPRFCPNCGADMRTNENEKDER